MDHEEKIMKVLMDHSENVDEFFFEWVFDDFFEDPNMRSCEVCGHKIRNCVRIANKFNGKKLVIGTDCAELILHGVHLRKMDAELKKYQRYQKSLKQAIENDKRGRNSGIYTYSGVQLSNVECVLRKYPEYAKVI